MKGFEPAFLDKLFDHDPRSGHVAPVLRRLSLEELKDSVARDIESLLNTRIVFNDEDLKEFPECCRSIISFGLMDIAGMSLASHYDRTKICRSLENAIARHERRLRNVKVALLVNEAATSVLHFSISAMLAVRELAEPVSFDATLQPTSLQYAVSKARRAAGVS